MKATELWEEGLRLLREEGEEALEKWLKRLSKDDLLKVIQGDREEMP